MKRKLLSLMVTFAVAMAFVAVSAVAVMADETEVSCPECGSTFVHYTDWNYNYVGADFHEEVYDYECSDCEHKWQVSSTPEAHDWLLNGTVGYKKYNSSKHYAVKEYRCSDCQKTENREVLAEHHMSYRTQVFKSSSNDSHKEYEEGVCYDCGDYASIYVKTLKHEWNHVQTEKGEDYTYKYSTTGKHIRYKHWECIKCEKKKTTSSTRDHVIGHFKVCTKCNYPTTSQTLVEGKYAYKSGRPYLKIVVKEDGYLTLTKKGEADLALLKSDKTNYSFFDVRVPVKKGTYYLRNCKRTKDENFKVKYTFTKMPPHQDNKTKKTAYKLSPGKTVTAVQFFKKGRYFYDRYYKITLTKASYISLWKPYGGVTEIYDTKGNWYSGHHEKGHKYVTNKKLPKGTYYIDLIFMNDDMAGDVAKLQWNYEK